jgi:hypothetical protein
VTGPSVPPGAPRRPVTDPLAARAVATLPDRLVLGFLAAAAATSVALLALQPLPHVSGWHTAPIVTGVVIAIWIVYRWRPAWFARNTWVLGLVLVLGLVVAAQQLWTLGSNAEVTRVYRALFRALDVGRNPYDCRCIPHHVASGSLRFGNFNYPPTEIWPYYLVYRAVREWNAQIFTAVLVALSAGACVLLRLTFPHVPLRVLACYFPLLVFLGLTTNSATALFMVALAVLLITRTAGRHGNTARELALVAVFSVGLLTKFVVIPLAAAFYWSRVRLRDARSWVRCAVSASAVLALAALQMAPFGVVNVLRETLLFNLELDVRAELTTYYPNVVSGLFYWLSLEQLFPVVAVAILAGVVLLVPALDTWSAMLVVVSAFMLVATTPEPQYLAVLLYVALAGSLSRTTPSPIPGPPAPAPLPAVAHSATSRT